MTKRGNSFHKTMERIKKEKLTRYFHKSYFDDTPKLGDTRLTLILIICSILGAQQDSELNHANLDLDPLMFLLLTQF